MAMLRLAQCSGVLVRPKSEALIFRFTSSGHLRPAIKLAWTPLLLCSKHINFQFAVPLTQKGEPHHPGERAVGPISKTRERSLYSYDPAVGDTDCLSFTDYLIWLLSCFLTGPAAYEHLHAQFTLYHTKC